MRCVNPQYIQVHRPVGLDDESPMKVPCGKCIPCLSKKRAEWSFRLEQEYKHSKCAHFVTLTFDREHYPADGNLSKRHVQLYLKRLRKLDGTNKIRYYAVGEYGTKGGRAHYHILVFNVINPDHCRMAWRDIKGKPIGIVHIGNVTEASVAYVTKYIVQPFEAPEGYGKPFALMSRAYGIGGKYLSDEMIAWHRSGDKNYCMRYNQKVGLCRFYRSKIWYNQNDKTRIAQKSHAFSTIQQHKEEEYYKKTFGTRWQEKKAYAERLVYQRVKTKVKYTQKL